MMRNKLIITIIILVIGLVWWGCENTINPTQPTINQQVQIPYSIPGFALEDCYVTLPSGLVSWWKADNNANDSEGSNNGTMSGGSYAAGYLNQAFSFDGLGDYVDVPNNPSLDFGSNQDFTLSAWFKAEPDQADWQGTILSKLSEGDDNTKRKYGYSLMVRGLSDATNEGKVGFWMGDGLNNGQTFKLYSICTYDDNEWHQVVLTADRDDMATLYVDGNLVNQADISAYASVNQASGTNFEIGRETPFDMYYFKGLIDETAIYSRALSPTEVKNIYEGCEVIGDPGGCGTPIGCTDELTTILYADETDPIGEVTIVSDCTDLTVTYTINDVTEPIEPWVFTALHLWVSTELEDLPKNAAPGKFPYSEKFEIAEGITTYTFTIPLVDIGAGCFDQLYIAAHSKVEYEVSYDVVTPDCFDTVWQIGDVEDDIWVVDHYEKTFYPDEFNYSASDPYPSFTTPFIVGTTPTNEFPYLSRGSGPSYATNFDVHWDGELPYGGVLTISWSPGGSGIEEKIVTVPGGSGISTGDIPGLFVYGAGWYLDKYPLVEHSFDVGSLSYDTHIFNFLQTKGDGTFWDWVRLEKPCVETVYEHYDESAWGYNDDPDLSFRTML
ncbi:LamG domain-containing protein, partial [Candidatus Neomarinimicrobiota bacterium]